jgi:hypothetical protein
MKRHIQRGLILAVILWSGISGIWSCGQQIGAACAFIYKHVRVI